MKKLSTIAALCGVALAMVVIALVARFAPSSTARREWKDKAIADIASRVADAAWVSREIEGLKKAGAGDGADSDRWLSERLILMRHGDWLAYANICQREDSRIADLFLARGSDGRWYYSTYHFCRGMIVLKGEEQSEDLAGFIKAYYLRPFDGHSDECLQKTWPQ